MGVFTVYFGGLLVFESKFKRMHFILLKKDIKTQFPTQPIRDRILFLSLATLLSQDL